MATYDVISIEQSSPADCEIVSTKISQKKKGDIMFDTFCCQPSSPIGTIEQVDFSINNLKEVSGLNRKHVLFGGGGGGGGPILLGVN